MGSRSDAPAGGPLPHWLAPLSWCLARGYSAATAWRNARFDRGKGVRRLMIDGATVPVVSIGNLTAGGTGKSPFVAWCASRLSDLGAVPVIALRGYRATSDGRSDEAEEYAATAPCARVVLGARRHDALREKLSAQDARGWRRDAVVLLDDGFQHRQLARDLDIVLVDATRVGLDGDLLPRGWLRERAEGIARAQLVVITKADDPAARSCAESAIMRIRGTPSEAACVHEWSGLRVHSGGAWRAEGVEWLQGRRVISACALGNPAQFHGMVARAGAVAVHQLEKPDHVAFDAEQLDRAAERAQAEAVVATRKDLVKLHALPRTTMVVPELAIRFVCGEGRVLEAISAARQMSRGS